MKHDFSLAHAFGCAQLVEICVLVQKVLHAFRREAEANECGLLCVCECDGLVRQRLFVWGSVKTKCQAICRTQKHFCMLYAVRTKLEIPVLSPFTVLSRPALRSKLENPVLSPSGKAVKTRNPSFESTPCVQNPKFQF